MSNTAMLDVWTNQLKSKLITYLDLVYTDQDNDALALRLIETMGRPDTLAEPDPHQNNWDQTDALLITYGDSICKDGEYPLRCLHKFLKQHLTGIFSGVHILPFFPYSSDDGFSVIDYLQVNDALGDWDDIEAIAKDFDLMSDLVINHVSSRSRWFENFKKRIEPGLTYFHEMDPTADLSAVVRPRLSPLLNAVPTLDGTRHVWCTFSADQVDLNFANPEVLIEIVGIIAHYLDAGVKLIRLDAVAFLWKQVGTSCIHLRQTHELIKLLRTLIEHRDPSVIIITETNVPNRENLTYFGNANEAHVIYNFSLPPLLINTLVSGNCRHLKTWLMSMPPAQQGTAYLNFIASHDGIGLRPAENLLTDEELGQLVGTMGRFGGLISTRHGADGLERPYEINIALWDALKGTVDGGEDRWQLQRFICAHAIMLGLEGIPAIYIHSLLGTENDYQRLLHTNQKRSINRHIWGAKELQQCLSNPHDQHTKVFEGLKKLLAIRGAQPAFHPNAAQFVMHLGQGVFAFKRQSIDQSQSIFCISNVSDQIQSIPIIELNLPNTEPWNDLISGASYPDFSAMINLQPYQTLWLTNGNGSN